MEVWARLTQFGIPPQYFDSQPMIAKRPKVLRYLLGTFMRNYNSICSCINKKAPRTGLFCCIQINHEAAQVQIGVRLKMRTR